MSEKPRSFYPRFGTFFRRHSSISRAIYDVCYLWIVAVGGFTIFVGFSKIFPSPQATPFEWPLIFSLWVVEVPIVMALRVLLGERRKEQREVREGQFDIAERVFRGRGINSFDHLRYLEVRSEEGSKPKYYLVNKDNGLYYLTDHETWDKLWYLAIQGLIDFNFQGEKKYLTTNEFERYLAGNDSYKVDSRRLDYALLRPNETERAKRPAEKIP